MSAPGFQMPPRLDGAHQMILVRERRPPGVPCTETSALPQQSLVSNTKSCVPGMTPRPPPCPIKMPAWESTMLPANTLLPCQPLRMGLDLPFLGISLKGLTIANPSSLPGRCAASPVRSVSLEDLGAITFKCKHPRMGPQSPSLHRQEAEPNSVIASQCPELSRHIAKVSLDPPPSLLPTSLF